MLTSRVYVPGANGVAVSTEVPINLFSLGDGESATVSGVVVMKLAGGRRRGLVLGGGRGGNEEEAAPFRLRVGLAREGTHPVDEKEEVAASSSPRAVWNEVPAFAVLAATIAGYALSS